MWINYLETWLHSDNTSCYYTNVAWNSNTISVEDVLDDYLNEIVDSTDEPTNLNDYYDPEDLVSML